MTLPPARTLTDLGRDEYLTENIFWVPKEARWSYLQAQAKSPRISILIDEVLRQALAGCVPLIASR